MREWLGVRIDGDGGWMGMEMVQSCPLQAVPAVPAGEGDAVRILGSPWVRQVSQLG